MFQIPQRPSARDRWDRREVVRRRRRTGGPFQRPCVPGIVARHGALEIRNDQVADKNQDGDGLDECADA